MNPARRLGTPVRHTGAMERGTLRVYLGAAAGVGTTYAMLAEAARRRERGATVMLGCVESHGRQRTVAAIQQLGGGVGGRVECDVETVLAAGPDLVLVDDLGHRSAAGADGRQRWQEVEVILAAGINVLATLTVGQIASLTDLVEEIVGERVVNTVPDQFLARIDQIEVVDISPEAIRRRIAHGNAFAADELRPAEADIFGSDGFASLRSLMMTWMADRLAATSVDPPVSREMVLVALSDSPTSDAVLRRAARVAQRARASLVGVYVQRPGDEATGRDARRRRVEELGGLYREVLGLDVAAALLSFANSSRATHLVVGTGPTRARIGRTRRTVVDEIVRSAPPLDLHIVINPADGAVAHNAPRLGRVPLRRQVAASVLGSLLLAALTVVLTANRVELSVATGLALYLLLVVGITARGGAVPGLLAAVVAPVVANWFLIPPYHTLRIRNVENLLELLAFVSVAAIVSAYVSIAERRAADIERARREATTLAALSGFGSLEQPEGVIEHLRSTFGLVGVAVLTGLDPDATSVAVAGDAPRCAADADLVTSLESGLVVAARGRSLTADDHRLLEAFLAHLSRAFEQQRLRRSAADAEVLARADELRTAILRAVSHDLRSPLASIKASVSSLLQPDVEWPGAVRDEFLTSIESETDRLTSIVTNLLDLSRLEAGVLRPVLTSVSLEEVVPAALRGLGTRSGRVRVELPADLAEVRADPVLLERAVANLVGNADAWSPPGAAVLISGFSKDERVQLHVIDRGPGIPAAQRQVVVQPFHRLADAGSGGGLGLGLAIADRLIVAMNGSLELRDTPSGGLTAVVSLPASNGFDR